MILLLVILHVIVCLFLIAVILLQAGRGQGLSWGVFGGTPQSIFGTKTASFMTRVTTVCACIFLISCIALNLIETRKSKSLISPPKPITKVDLDKIKKALEDAAKTKPAEPTTVPATTPSAPAPVAPPDTHKTTDQTSTPPETTATQNKS